MDFEKSVKINVTDLKARDWFVYDLNKFFMFMSTLCHHKDINPSDVKTITAYINTIDINRPISRKHVVRLLELVDGMGR